MEKNRLEAFSDGVIAIIITIMVLEFKVPHGDDPGALRPLLPVLVSYVLSFVHVGIYWNNHHHMLQAVKRVNGAVLWANLHLLFWLSLLPFVTAWMGENHFAAWPVALYGVDLIMAGCAYYVLAHALVRYHGRESAIAAAIGNDFKGKMSVVAYAVAIPLSFVNRWVAFGIYVAVALSWLVPDRRFERVLGAKK
ncbi:MAG TPA: TMEM175 family protein [bacterium]|nr:TMEM175 family protein [bacterium]